MKEILKNLFVGSDADCSSAASGIAVIHACKTCHQRGVGYSGNLSSTHPNYLIYENGNHLFLNMVDMERELLAKFTHPIMESALAFIRFHIADKKVIIHCNQGQSRSPSIGLIYLAQTENVSKQSYQVAKREFSRIYPAYLPGTGIELYLINNWESILEL